MYITIEGVRINNSSVSCLFFYGRQENEIKDKTDERKG